MHKTNCRQSIEQSSMWKVFSSICPLIQIHVRTNHIYTTTGNEQKNKTRWSR